ncbi:hypothetical protein DVA67_028705 [Solirubrobacter sp. CPCC 204708]|uniref:Uncharacterized protein n=1 Tax=Solirubrobacter deserti TaxID=2282478 RepID=A0ABT4RPD6_9ACTN|nr:hypothetical protein [Solirubrobacter deserti]MBE2319979.1 hypothetical protein [Solirubrobacter deserti]MDA0140424.1 hypothetical protein [Solirubrobacter deserti]
MITVRAQQPAPYIHADNRGLVLCNGPQCAFVPASQLRFAAETFAIIAEEGRATRSQATHVVGGYRDGGEVTLYVGTQDQLLSVTVSEADFNAVREAIGAR